VNLCVDGLTNSKSRGISCGISNRFPFGARLLEPTEKRPRTLGCNSRHKVLAGHRPCRERVRRPRSSAVLDGGPAGNNGAAVCR